MLLVLLDLSESNLAWSVSSLDLLDLFLAALDAALSCTSLGSVFLWLTFVFPLLIYAVFCST